MCTDCKFSPKTKRLLEVEAGFACANPSCRRTTVSPSDSRASGTSQRGEAAHIAAAKKGMARYEESQTHDQRSSPENGIWLCRDHAKAIDDDWIRFTTPLLQRWKQLARSLSQARADAFPQVPAQGALVVHARELDPRGLGKEALRDFVAEFLDDVGAASIWSDGATDSVRQLLTEWCFNAATHGSASILRLSADERSLTLRHDGELFSIHSLLTSSNRRGGAGALDFFLRTFGDHFACSDSQAGEDVCLIVSDVRFHPAADNRCTVSSQELATVDIGDLESRVVGCRETHVYVRPRWTMSDGYEDLPKLVELADATVGTLVIHSPKPSPMLAAFVAAELPGARLAVEPSEDSDD